MKVLLNEPDTIKYASEKEDGLEVRGSVSPEDGGFAVRVFLKNYKTQSLISEPRRHFYKVFSTQSSARGSLVRHCNSFAKTL